MPSTASVAKTNDPYIDGVLSGIKWGTTSLTYSFPTDSSFYGTSYGNNEHLNNFEAFTLQQQDAVRTILQMYSSVSNLTFSEVTESATVHGDLRYAESDSPGTAWAYYPSTSAAGGDAWFNNSKNYYDNPIKGNYAWLTMLHETGHALGLKHPHEVKGSFAAMPADHDSLEYSVMSYHSYVGSPLSGYTNATYSYPQTLMMYDIAAIQVMYGANYNTNNGDSTYRWSPTTGEMSIDGVGQGAPGGNKIFMTIWDGGGQDTYDFSNYSTNVSVNLTPGEWITTSATQLAYLGGGYYATGNIANALLYQGNLASIIENAVGGSGHDTLIGNVVDNWLTGNAGNDYLDGGLGGDTAVYAGGATSFRWVENPDGSWTITDLRTVGSLGTDTLINIEYLQFSDELIALGTELRLPPPENHAPVITSATSTLSVTEWADKSTNEANNVAHTGTGTIAFSDLDGADSFTATVAAKGSGYLGSFSLDSSAIAQGSLQWSFSVSDSAIDYLKAGQTLTQSYDVTIQDSFGATAVQTVTVTITGSDDATVKVTGKGVGNPKKGGSPNGETVTTDSASHDSFGHFNIADDQVPAPIDSTSGLLPWLLGSQNHPQWDFITAHATNWLDLAGHHQNIVELLGLNTPVPQHDILS